MLETPLTALLLAGFTLAHAVWSVSDTAPEELLVPLAIVESVGRRTLERYEAPTQAAAIARGKANYRFFSASYDAWAFAREGAMRIPSTGDETRDVIVVDFWAKGMTAPLTIVQAFERTTSARGFRVVGEPILMAEGRVVSVSEAEPMVREVLKGVRSHPNVASLWGTWTSAP